MTQLTEIEDAEKLNRIMVPLSDVRAYIAGLMRDGETEIGLGDLLYVIKNIYLEKRGDSQSLEGGLTNQGR